MSRMAVVAFHHAEATLPLARHLAKLGHEVDYLLVVANGKASAPACDFGRRLRCPGARRANQGDMAKTLAYLGGDCVKVTLLVLPPYPRRLFYPLSRAFFFGVGAWLRRGRYSLINVVGQNGLLADVHRGLGRAKGVFHSLHETLPHYSGQSIERGLHEYLVRSGSRFIVHSRAMHERLLERFPNCADRVHTIPFGVFESYRLFDTPEARRMVEGRYVLFVGTLTPYKGLGVLKRAVDILGSRLKGCRVVVAGAGTDPAVLEMENDSRFVVMQRYIENRELVNLVKNALCVVCPYTSASQSGIVATAFLFGRPVVASDVGGFAETVRSGHNGVLVNAGDAEALASALVRIAEDEKYRRRLEEGALSFEGEAGTSWEAIARRYEALAE